MQETMTEGGPTRLASALVSTLQQEHDALARLCAQFEMQMAAMRQRRPEQLEEATLSVAEEVGTLSRLQQTRERQMRLLGRVLNLGDRPAFSQFTDKLEHTDSGVLSQALAQAREMARNQAFVAQERCKELEFTLNYASDLGREMLHALRGPGIGAPAMTYTARGQMAAGGETRAFVNHQG